MYETEGKECIDIVVNMVATVHQEIYVRNEIESTTWKALSGNFIERIWRTFMMIVEKLSINRLGEQKKTNSGANDHFSRVHVKKRV